MNKGKVAVVLLINNEGEILLQLRDDDPLIQSPNTWGFVGGHLDKGEKLLETIKREVREELNINIKNPIFIAKFDDRVGNDVFVYRVKMDVKAEEIKLTEGQEVRFFYLKDIMKLDRVPKCMIDFFQDNKDKIFK